MVDFSNEYYREAKFFYSKTYITEMFQRNSIPCRFFRMDKGTTEDKMDAVYLDESDPYIVDLQGGTKELDGEKYFGRHYSELEDIHCVFTTEKTREENLLRFGLQVNERIENLIFLASQVIPVIGDYIKIPLHQEYDELERQVDGRVLPDDEMYMVYIITHSAPDESGMLSVTVARRVDKPVGEEDII